MSDHPLKLDFSPASYFGTVVRAVSLSHQVTGSKQPLRRFCGGKACLGFSLPQTPLMWEPPALGLPFLLAETVAKQSTIAVKPKHIDHPTSEKI